MDDDCSVAFDGNIRQVLLRRIGLGLCLFFAPMVTQSQSHSESLTESQKATIAKIVVAGFELSGRLVSVPPGDSTEIHELPAFQRWMSLENVKDTLRIIYERNVFNYWRSDFSLFLVPNYYHPHRNPFVVAVDASGSRVYPISGFGDTNNKFSDLLDDYVLPLDSYEKVKWVTVLHRVSIGYQTDFTGISSSACASPDTLDPHCDSVIVDTVFANTGLSVRVGNGWPIYRAVVREYGCYQTVSWIFEHHYLFLEDGIHSVERILLDTFHGDEERIERSE